jgi:hypothetical protein
MSLLAFVGALLLSAQVSPVNPPRPTVRPKMTPTPVAVQGPLKARSRKERMDRYMVAAMRRSGVDAWLVVTREGTTDPVAFDVAADYAVGRAACLFVDKGDRLERVAVVASYDTEAFEKSGLYARVVPYARKAPAWPSRPRSRSSTRS